MPSLCFDWVSLDSFRGFQGRGFKLEGLEPGIIVIHGPNGAGKSSLARAMELLLWEEVQAPENTALSAGVRLGDRPQHRTRFEGKLTAKEGPDATPPSPWPSPATRDRYRLSLSDLLQAGDANQAFGEQLRQEMQGGVDFPRHRAAVGALQAFSRKGALTAAFEQATAAVTEQAKAQGALEALEAELRRQRAELATQGGLEAEERHLSALDKAMDQLAVLLEREAALVPFQDREPALALLGASGEDRFLELRTARDGAHTRAGALRLQLDRLASERDALALPPDLRDEHAEEARSLAKAIADAEEATRLRAEATTEAEASLAAWRQANAWLDLDAGQLPSLSRELLNRTRRLARSFEQSQSLIHALRRLTSDLGPEETPQPLEPLTAASSILEQWLERQAALEARTLRPEPRERWGAFAWVFLAAGSLAGAAALFLGRGGSGAGLGAVAATLVLLVLAAAGLRAPARDGEDAARLHLGLEALQKEFEALRLPGLTLPAWSPADVRILARRARETAAAAGGLAVLNGARTRARAQLEAELSTWRTLLAEAGQLARLLNLPAEVNDAFGGYLEVLCRRLLDGLALRSALTTAESLHDAASERLTLLTGRADGLLQAHGRTPGTDRVGRLTILARAMDTSLRLRREQAALEQDLDDLGRDDPAGALGAFLAQRGLEEDGFREAWATRQRWQPLMAAHTVQFNLVESLLAQESRWTPEFQALADRGASPLPCRQERFAQARADLKARHASALQTLERLRETGRDLARNEATLDRLTRAGTLASLILARDQAAQRLEEQRVRDLEARTLGRLLDLLERRGADEDLKPQLRRASDLFRDFTGHRYELRFEHGAFVAREGHRYLSLDQLSEGTRLQLLMAVRLAYVEHQEGTAGVQLPLFLDEVLANSDDTRALAVIEAIKVMARTGRQIFYFTAQEDEVAKWRLLGPQSIQTRCLGSAQEPRGGARGGTERERSDRAVPPRSGQGIQIIDLTGTRDLEARRTFPLPSHDVLRHPVPGPGDDTLLAYARRLEGAHGPALWTPLAEQHAWLAFAEGEQHTLHALLQGGLATLGQVRIYMKTQPGPEAERLVTTLEILEEAQAELQAARPRPLTPAELGRAVIGINDLSNLLLAAQACGYDPARLLANPIAGVGPTRRENLRDWLRKGGFLVEDPKPAEAILIGLKGRHSSRLGLQEKGWLAVERFLTSGAT